ncbi:MAG TPA: SurA N-terminal domain-containing protein [Xanthobacteraceae bacterium]|nr:SurA N-terminal domain-containing protein [Xanthobacteraceae bacterium]
MLTNTVRWTVAARMLTAAVIVFAPSLARAQQVVALVDGQPITQLDLEQRTKFDQMSNPNKAAPTRQAVIDELVDEILELREAKRFGIVVPDSEVDDSFSGVAAHMGADSQKLTEMLARGGASANTLKQRLRAQMAWAALIRGRYKASLEIADSDVEAQLELHKPEDKNEVGYEYIMRPIVFVVPRGSSDSTFEARKHEAESLRGRFQNCDSGISFARALSEVAVRDQVVKFSADLPQALRDILDKTDVGHLTPPEQTAEGIQMFALCSKKETKSDTPGKKEVRDEIFQKKFGARAKRYLAELRRSAMIEYKQ